MPPDPASCSPCLTDGILCRNAELFAEFFLQILSEDVVEIDSIGVLSRKQEVIKAHHILALWGHDVPCAPPSC